MLKIYIVGITILLIAILANGLVIKLGVKSWYDFISLLSNDGSLGFNKLSIIDYLWLFIGYPFVLGFGYWIGDKIYHQIFT
ncbi:DUF7672 family protein [Winogradskyella flava]|uniref:DUF7672 family protein n=1 Tax=Winogradskyella flava TaxID=1884876 RepID=UPI0024903579|nr:hypothetical protein [Winogradskyella flava]